MSIEDKVYVKKPPCAHEEAIFDGNYDWPGLRCKKCYEDIPEEQAKNYQERK